MKIQQYDLDGLGAEFKLTEELEQKIADFLGVKYCVLVNSGTTAIFLALRALGAKKVAVPDLTMFATASAAELAGCDITFVSKNEVPEDVDTYVHVSLNGRDCDIENVVSNYPNLQIIEDAAQSFGSLHNGQYLGTFGKVGCFSFSPHKILSAGNGGCIVTNQKDIAKEVRKLKNFGRDKGGADTHESIGYNFKFTDIQADFVLRQFGGIEKKVEKKKEIYQAYYDKLKDIMFPHRGTPWFVDIYVDDRDGLAEYLEEKGIGTRKMYPLITTHPPFAKYKKIGDDVNDLYRSMHGLWLPSSLSLSGEELDFITDAVLSWISNI